VVVIQANDVNPLFAKLEIDLTASPPEVLVEVTCVITINFEIFGAEPFDLSGSVFGRIGGGEKPAFGVEAVIPLEWFKDFHKAVRPPYSPSVFISNVKCEAGDSSCLIVPVQGLGGEFRELEGGLQMFWKGPSFIPALCVEEVEIALSIARIKPPQLHFMGKCEFDDAEWNITSVPTVNFFAFASLELFAKLTVYARGAAITFGMTAEFHLGTGNATCKEEDKKGDPSEGGCLVTEIEVELEVGVQLTPAGPEVNAIGVIRGETSGAWLDPLGLSNFAFIDPAIALGMKVAVKPCPSPSGICPTVEPQEFRFVLTVLWKRDAKREWPEELLWKALRRRASALGRRGESGPLRGRAEGASLPTSEAAAFTTDTKTRGESAPAGQAPASAASSDESTGEAPASAAKAPASGKAPVPGKTTTMSGKGKDSFAALPLLDDSEEEEDDDDDDDAATMVEREELRTAIQCGLGAGTAKDEAEVMQNLERLYELDVKLKKLPSALASGSASSSTVLPELEESNSFQSEATLAAEVEIEVDGAGPSKPKDKSGASPDTVIDRNPWSDTTRGERMRVAMATANDDDKMAALLEQSRKSKEV